MASFAERMASARAMANHPRIRVTDIEARLGTRFTADTLEDPGDAFSTCRFVWLMGADNLAQICVLAGLDQNLSSRANCGFRPPYLY